MLYFNRNGVWFKVPLKQGAIYSRDLLEKQIHTSLLGLQKLKDRSPDLDQMRFEKPGEFLITSSFGRDEIIINPPTVIERGGKEKITLPAAKFIPAIEVFDIYENFKGVVLCNSGTFEPSYEYLEFADNIVDPFNWGQWQWWYASKPYSETRTEKIIGYKKYDNVEKLILEVPNKAEKLANFSQTDGTANEVKTWAEDPLDPEYKCDLFPDPNGYCDGPTCRALRSDQWNYTVTDFEEYQNYWEIIDTSWNMTGESVVGATGDSIYNATGNNSYLGGPGITSFCVNPGDPHAECPYCLSQIELEDSPPESPSGTYPNPVLRGTDTQANRNSKFIWSAHTDYFFDNITWSDENESWTNFESGSVGGMVAAFDNTHQVGDYYKPNPLDSLSDYNAVLWFGGNYNLSGNISEVEVDVSNWEEGAIVDGTKYVANSGSGYYYELDDPIYNRGVQPRYYGSSCGTPIIFMSSFWRNVSKNFTYYFISSGSLTSTDFTYSHTLSSVYYHSIPGFDNLFGKGYFRLVKVIEPNFEEIEYPV